MRTTDSTSTSHQIAARQIGHVTEEANDVDRYLAAAANHSPFKEGALDAIRSRDPVHGLGLGDGTSNS